MITEKIAKLKQGICRPGAENIACPRPLMGGEVESGPEEPVRLRKNGRSSAEVGIGTGRTGTL
jgi:hypothetical protein